MAEPFWRRSGPDGSIRHFDPAWLRFTGRTIDAARGVGWLDDVHAEDRARCMSIHAEMLASHAAYSLDYRLRNATGVYRWVMENAVPQFAPDGSFDGFVHHGTDVHDRTLIGRELAAHGAALRGALQHHAAFEAALARELDRLPRPQVRVALETMARIARRPAARRPARWALSAWLDAVVREARAALPADAASTLLSTPPDAIDVDIDASVLTPALVNALLGHVALSRNGGAIELSATSTGRQVQFALPGGAGTSASILLECAVQWHGGEWLPAPVSREQLVFTLPVAFATA